MFNKVKKQFRGLIGRYQTFTTHPLTQDKPVAALQRYLSYHLHHRLVSQPGIYPFVNHLRFFAQPGLGHIGHHIYFGLYDFAEMGFLLHFLRSEDLFIDVGANAGAYALLAGGICESTTIAVEPLPTTYTILADNIRLNDLEGRIEARNIGLGANETHLHFSTTKSSAMNHVVLEPDLGGSTIAVAVSTLDTLVSESTPPALVKIDVEGFEYNVLCGASTTLAAPELKAIIIELNGFGMRYGYSDEVVHNLLEQHDFAPYTYDPKERALHSLPRYNQYQFNTIYLRDLDFVQERVRTAPAFRVLNKEI